MGRRLAVAGVYERTAVYLYWDLKRRLSATPDIAAIPASAIR